jgi:RNA-binding protein YhbY
LRDLGVGDDEEEEEEDGDGDKDSPMPATGQEKLGDLLRRDWVRPDTILEDDSDDESVFPWERKEVFVNDEEVSFEKKKPVRAPSLAELTMEDEELRRLRRLGMTLRERISVAKAGVTGAIQEKIHDQWRKSELVRLKFHETLARDMRTAHEIVERRTGGLVIWRSGSVMVVYRGTNYSGPKSKSQSVDTEHDNLFVPESSTDDNPSTSGDNASDLAHERRIKAVLAGSVESMTEEEKEINTLLDGLGPRFDDWWGTGVLPVDADLLPQTINGYKTPFRLLPTGMRPGLTNAEMTNMRKLAKSLPCHFALGRNRNHQGLALAIIELWEKSLVAKIAVKRGVQNTNNELMAEEIKRLTGGVLLLRNKYYIVIYRGKDFVPTTVASALAERQELTKEIQDSEEKMRRREPLPLAAVTEEKNDVTSENGQVALAGTLAEFYQAQAQWGREKTAEEHERMIEAASRTKTVRVVKRLEHKLFIAQSKKNKAEKELAKIRESWLPSCPPEDLETITDEERVMFRRVGLKMKPYLPLGIRGVFDGVIENMHLHWKHRELVKLISKQKDHAFVEETARLLEYESGGILVDIVKVSKGYAVMYYRGKNYQRPISIRPRSLPTKARALKRWKALQRYEALSQHISEVESAIAQMDIHDGDSGEVEDFEDDEFNSKSEDEMNSDGDESEESDWEDVDDDDDDDDDDS